MLANYFQTKVHVVKYAIVDVINNITPTISAENILHLSHISTAIWYLYQTTNLFLSSLYFHVFLVVSQYFAANVDSFPLPLIVCLYDISLYVKIYSVYNKFAQFCLCF